MACFWCKTVVRSVIHVAETCAGVVEMILQLSAYQVHAMARLGADHLCVEPCIIMTTNALEQL
jgi:hypothetical protein